jgi:pimeloyl-ACP methyl ester carboxylesterase
MDEFIQLNNQKIKYNLSGNGNPVILLHGWGCDLNIFQQIQNNLLQWFTVYSIDFPGFGGSQPPLKAWSVYDYADITQLFLLKLNIKNPILIGHSFGGRVSIILSSRLQIKKVILVDSAGIKPPRSLKYYLKVYSFKALKNIMRFPVIRNYSEPIMEKYRNKFGSKDYQNVSGVMRETFVKVVNEDLKPLLPKIKTPTLLIWGENDTATPVSDARIMEKLIPDCGLVVLKNCGHYSFLEKLTEFLIVINNFLEKDK